MDELIYLIIKIIGEIFGGGQGRAKGPGFPNFPPPPMPQQQLPPQLPDLLRAPETKQQQIRRRMLEMQGGPRPRPAAQLEMQRQAMQRRGIKPVVKKPVQKKRPKAVSPPPVIAAPVMTKVAPPQSASSVPTVHRAPTVAVDAAALRRWLRPQVLHNQFMLSEIFQPPLALRE